MTKPPRPVFTPDATTRAVIYHLAGHPDDTLSWAALADLLEAAEAPAAAILVARRCGLWRGTREQWEQQGPDVVDVVPVRWVWVIDCAPRFYNLNGKRTWDFYTGKELELDPDDISIEWHRESTYKEFATAEAAQSWLTEIALAYARRVRDGEEAS